MSVKSPFSTQRTFANPSRPTVLHTDLVERFRKATEAWSYSQIIHSSTRWEEGGALHEEEQRRESRFSFRGRAVDNTEAIAILPGASEADATEAVSAAGSSLD